MTGKDLVVILSQGGVAVASTCVKSQDIRTHCDALERSSAQQQSWVEVIAGRKSWTIQISYLVLSAARVGDLLLVGQQFDVTVRDVDNTYRVTGKALLTDVGHVATVGTLAQGLMSLQGNGGLT